MKALTHFRRHTVWLQLQVPVALLLTLLQRSPAVRLLAALEERAAAAPLGAVLQSALAVTAGLGAVDSLAGATSFAASTPGPLSAKVGTPVTTVAFTVTNTINIASWKIGGTLPPGVQLAAREGGSLLSGPGTLEAPPPTGGGPDPYGADTTPVPTTTPYLTGTPTQAGTYTFTLQAYQSPGLTGLASNTFSYTVQVAADVSQPSNVAPTISAQPQSQTVTAGATVTFSIAASGTPAPTYEWRKDGVVVAGATSATLTLTNVQASAAGVYTVAVSNSAGSVTSAAAALTVNTPTSGTAPTIAAQPAAQTIASGSTVVFNVAASGSPTPAFQWRKDGAAIAGANSANLIVSNATAASAGTYSVLVTNSTGSVTSAAVTLSVTNTPVTAVGRLANLSILTTAGSGARALTIGATIGGANAVGSLPLVIRAVGPTLATSFGLAGVLDDPVLALNVAGSATPLLSNDNWGGSAAVATAFSNVAAFALPTGSLDAAIVPAAPGLAIGGYTVQVTGKGSASGTVIAEIYDATGEARTATTPRLTNLSTLTAIDAGTNLAVGFVIGGTTARTLLVRGVGPTLGSTFGLPGTMADPKLELYNNSTGAKIAENNDWGGDNALAGAQASVGAFALAAGTSKDAVLLVTLPPGQYSARVSGTDGGGGTAIVEVYEVP